MKIQINRYQRLDLLAQKYYGDRRSWKIIRQRNGFTMPFGQQLQPGMIIQIPEV